MPIATIEWKAGRIKLIDQNLLPGRLKYIYFKDMVSLRKATRNMQIRGAPVIGIASALGVVLGMKRSRAKNYSQFKSQLEKVTHYLQKARPTAVNLAWALKRMEKVAEKNSTKSVSFIKKALLNEALKIIREDKIACRRMAKFAQRFLKTGQTILTHCNAGSLATADYGTALGIFYLAKRQGKRIKVYATETRPLLQGARLTTWELTREGIDVTLICDSVACKVMEEGLINKVFVGADRITSGGDVANKIGTYNLAVLAKYHKIPFYVVAPASTFDLSLSKGEDIPIEERDPREVSRPFGKEIAPKGVKVYNPAFDVTPRQLITAIITEKGVIYPPFARNIKKVLSL